MAAAEARGEQAEAPVAAPITPSLRTAPARPLSEDDLAKLPLQALLVRAAYLTVDQLSQALSESVTNGRPVEEIAVERGWVSRADVDSLVQAKHAATTGSTPVAAAPTAMPIAPAPVEASTPEVHVTPVLAEAPALEPVAPAPEPQLLPVQLSSVDPAPVIEPPSVDPTPATEPVAEAAAPPPPPPAPEPEREPEPELINTIPVFDTPAVESPAPPAPVVGTPAPTAHLAAPAPAAPVQPISVGIGDVEAVERTVGVFLHLTSGERMWVGRFATQEEAEQYAQHLVSQLIRPEPGVWPSFNGRLVRPEAVVSIELSRRLED